MKYLSVLAERAIDNRSPMAFFHKSTTIIYMVLEHTTSIHMLKDVRRCPEEEESCIWVKLPFVISW
ncbi:hypothetical protein Bhyg_02151 [Pseudolycoriella hygida]|uniref:Uncharacterized protein n=1 Tax=Pseudolycoriella hygida TaxID=35572 RepID=A0A9Q0NAZ3_9DIPT|nr:hypothetical protein Bhyg_02151 [Pseudolycoriella hygida]